MKDSVYATRGTPCGGVWSKGPNSGNGPASTNTDPLAPPRPSASRDCGSTACGFPRIRTHACKKRAAELQTNCGLPAFAHRPERQSKECGPSAAGDERAPRRPPGPTASPAQDPTLRKTLTVATRSAGFWHILTANSVMLCWRGPQHLAVTPC